VGLGNWEKRLEKTVTKHSNRMQKRRELLNSKYLRNWLTISKWCIIMNSVILHEHTFKRRVVLYLMWRRRRLRVQKLFVYLLIISTYFLPLTLYFLDVMYICVFFYSNTCVRNVNNALMYFYNSVVLECVGTRISAVPIHKGDQLHTIAVLLHYSIAYKLILT